MHIQLLFFFFIFVLLLHSYWLFKGISNLTCLDETESGSDEKFNLKFSLFSGVRKFYEVKIRLAKQNLLHIFFLFESESIRKPSHDVNEHSTVMLCSSLERRKWQKKNSINLAAATAAAASATYSFFDEIRVSQSNS